MTFRSQNLDPDREARAAMHERALATQRQPSTYNRVLRELIAAVPDEDITEERLAEFRNTAKTIASLGNVAPPVAPKPSDAKAAARARLAELDAAPLGAGAHDHLRLARADERTKLLTIVHDLGPSRPGPEAA